MSLVVPEDGMHITRDTVLQPGVYYLPNGLIIDADHVTLDGNGALLIGADFRGRGVHVQRRSGVSIRNLHLERYYHGVWANACANLRIAQCSITRTSEVAGPDVFLDVWLDRDEAYGGAILLSGVIDSVVTGNDLQHQQNGLMMYGCDHVEVSDNDASFNSGAGLLLYRSSDNIITRNRADFCSRIYHYPDHARSGNYHNGADAAGLVIMCDSSRNAVSRNMLRGGGDGVFLGGFHKDRIKTPCNDNVFEGNDGSWSPNIAFEATFSERNIFRHNRADGCNYGFWLGYSSHTRVEDNTIKDNRIAGVAIEHGHHNTIQSNLFERNRDGVQLWVGAQPAFIEYYPECAESHETIVVGNSFARHEVAVKGWTARGAVAAQRCRRFVVRDNVISDNRVGVHFERVRDSAVTRNRVLGNVEAGIRLVGCSEIATDGNTLA